jgi:hypothetical protein
VQDIPEPQPLLSPPKSTASTAGRPGLIRSETNEWSSPAFVKRARVSYGSLFESGYDIFAEEDGTVQGKGRKRTRFNRESGAWRYSSRSQSPEPSHADEDMVDSGFLEPDEEHQPMMTDEGCQTLGLEDDNAVEALADLSGLQAAAVVSGNRLGIHEVSAPGLTGDLDRSEASVDMRPPPMPHVTLEDGIQEESAKQEASTHTVKNAWDPAQTNLIPPDTQSRTPPSERSDPVAGEATHPSATDVVEDLYGLSPTADGYPRNATPRPDVYQTASNHDDVQLTSDNDHYEPSHPFDERPNTITYPKLPSRSASPDKVVDTTLQVYPELDMALNHDVAAQSGPYFGEQFQNYPDIDGDHLHQQSEGHWDMHAEDVRSPNTISLAEHKIPHDISMQELSARHLSPGGIAMSRSQSGHSEMIDLTEDSDEEVEGPAEGSQTDDEEEANEQFYRDGRVEDQSGDEEGYENLLYDENGSESAENEFDYDEDNMRHPPGFHPVKHLAPGEVADDDEEEDFEGVEFEEEEIEEEGSYDDEDSSDEENVSTAIKQPRRGEPEVIDLLSSDEEDVEDDNTGRDPSEAEESAAARMNETNSMFVEEEESDVETESDVENSEGEVMEDGHAEEDPLDEPRLIEFKTPAKQTAMEDSEGLIDRSASEEADIEDADEMEKDASSQGILSNTTYASGSFQDIQFDSRKETPATGGQLVSYGGHDGAFDTPDRLLMASREAEEEGTTAAVNGDEVPMGVNVTYPILPIIEAVDEDRPLRQEKNVQDEDTTRMSKNDQLPTPDATQLTAVMAPDTSFSSVGSFQPLLDRMESMDSGINDVENSSKQKAMEVAQRDRHPAPVTESAIDPPEEAAMGATIGAVGVAAEAVAKDAARDVPTDAVTNAATEVMPGNAPVAALSAAAEVTEKTMIETIQPVTPRRSKRLSFSQQHRKMVERSPSINMDEPTTPDDYDASVELAMAALDSPTKPDSNEHQISDKQLRVMLSRPLRTNLGVFTTLKLVRFNLEKKLDVLAIVTTLPSEPQRAKGGQRHYHLRFNITDATIAPCSVVGVNIFRPYKTALPAVQPGECVLLRNFLAKSEKGVGFTLRSDDGSSWVVFKNGGEEEVKGPPVEYGDGEKDHATYLKAWYRNLDANSRERLEKANGDKGSEMGRSMG